MAGHESKSSESDTLVGLSDEALRTALTDARAALRDARQQTQRAHEGLVDFLHFDLHEPLSTIEAECKALLDALPPGVPDSVREGLELLRAHIKQLRTFLGRSLETTRNSAHSPF